MSDQILRQPNALYAIFSSIVDGFTAMDLTRDELVEFYVDKAREEAVRYIDKVCGQLSRGEKPYHQFTRTWEEAVEENNRNFPEEPVKL